MATRILASTMCHTYSWSTKVSLQTGRQWRRTRHTPAFVVHLMLGLHSLVSTMMWQTSHHLSSSVQVCSLPLSVIYANWKSVLDPTMKDLYIKHYWAPQYQVITMDNIYDIVSTLTLNLSYYWILSVSWVPCHSPHQSHVTKTGMAWEHSGALWRLVPCSQAPKHSQLLASAPKVLWTQIHIMWSEWVTRTWHIEWCKPSANNYEH